MARIRKREAKITPAAVEAFRAGDADALSAALRLAPWEWPTPLDVEDNEPCPYPGQAAGAVWWPRCLELRRILKEAAAEPKDDA